MPKEAYLVPNPLMPCRPVLFNEDVCNGCNECVDVCRKDVLMPNPKGGKPPLIVYPDECYFCGHCVQYCPTPGASRFNHPLLHKAYWKRKETGEFFRIGMKNPPPPNTKPVIG